MKRILIYFYLALSLSSQNFAQSENEYALILFVKNAETGQVDPQIKLNATYGGYATITNQDGQILFPRQSVDQLLHVLITPKIQPVFCELNNVWFWQIAPESPSKLYQLELTDDSQTWRVIQTSIPDNNFIPLHTIVILANPEQIFMNSETNSIRSSGQLFLPSLFAKPQASNELIVNLINYAPFLKILRTTYTPTPYGYAKIQIP